MCPQIFENVIRTLEFYGNGRRFGFLYLRRKTFKLPGSINVSGNKVIVRHPTELGVTADFLDCFVFNVYGYGKKMSKVEKVLDIGANIGFSALAARGFYPRAIIHAYEPNPRVLPMLFTNTQGQNIQIFSEAVGGNDGYATLIDERESNAAQVYFCGSAAGSIRQVSLDTAIERMGGTVDLLKLDCEGAEWQIFRQSRHWDKIHNLRMEYHLFRGESRNELFDTLSKLGFRVLHEKSTQRLCGIVWAARVD